MNRVLISLSSVAAVALSVVACTADTPKQAKGTESVGSVSQADTECSGPDGSTVTCRSGQACADPSQYPLGVYCTHDSDHTDTYVSCWYQLYCTNSDPNIGQCTPQVPAAGQCCDNDVGFYFC